MIGAARAATIELRETSRLETATRANTTIKITVAMGARANKAPSAVATPLPPSNYKNTG